MTAWPPHCVILPLLPPHSSLPRQLRLAIILGQVSSIVAPRLVCPSRSILLAGKDAKEDCHLFVPVGKAKDPDINDAKNPGTGTAVDHTPSVIAAESWNPNERHLRWQG